MSKTSLTTFCLFLGKNITSDSKARSCLIFMTWIIEFVTNESQAKHVCYILWQTLMYYVCSTTIFIGSLLCSQEHEPNGKAYKICRNNFIFRTMSGELFFSFSVVVTIIVKRLSLMLKGLRYTRSTRTFPHIKPKLW